jgi:hypothetical protein
VKFAKQIDPTDAKFDTNVSNESLTYTRAGTNDVETYYYGYNNVKKTFYAWRNLDYQTGSTMPEFVYTETSLPRFGQDILVAYDKNDEIISHLTYSSFRDYEDVFKEFKSFNDLNLPFENYTSSNDYWEGCNLDAWEGKCAVIHDNTRFDWANSGYFVIYHLKDEWGNEAPYDFKNIMSQATYTTQQLNNYYTFSTLDENDNIIDASLHGKAKNNVIRSKTDTTKYVLNKIILESEGEIKNNTIENDCDFITLLNGEFDIKNNTIYRGSESIRMIDEQKLSDTHQKVIGYRTSDNVNPVIANPLDYLISGINKTLSN